MKLKAVMLIGVHPASLTHKNPTGRNKDVIGGSLGRIDSPILPLSIVMAIQTKKQWIINIPTFTQATHKCDFDTFKFSFCKIFLPSPGV